jgi:hypothetical protein
LETEKILHGLEGTGPLKLDTGKNWLLKGGELVTHPPDCVKGVRLVVLQGVVLGKDIHHEHRFHECVGGGGAWCGQETRTSDRVWCGPMSRGSNGSSILGPSDSRRRGGHSGRQSWSAREGGNRHCEGETPQIRCKHGITLVARKGTTLPTTATSAIRSAATAGATTAATATREGDGHCYLLDTDCSQGKQYRRSVLPPLLPPPQNSSGRNQYKITKSTAKKDFRPSIRDFCPFGSKIP